jgi:UDP-2-acetamido-2-deoxy-ribo-hexuluronate aminotransferase
MQVKQRIGMLDLVGQYRRLQSEIDAAMDSVLERGDFIQGSSVTLFEQELADYLSVPHVISCGNGTDALQLAFMALDLPAGSEVILPSFAYAALAEVILLLGLSPVFVEVNPSTYLIQESAIEAAITTKTRVIAPVHLFGCMANMDAIMDIAHRYNLYVVEDAAQAIGSYYSGVSVRGFAGTLGTVGTTSFFPSKNLGCFGDGGAVFCSNLELATRIRQLANHGQSTKYIHDIVGINSRLDTLQAAVLRVKLGHLDDFHAKRLTIAQRYVDGLQPLQDQGLLQLPCFSGINSHHSELNSTHVFHQFTLRIIAHEKRDAFRQFMSDRGIATMVYYPLPLHRQNAYFQKVALPVTEELCSQVVSLPICPELRVEAQQEIILNVKEFFQKP